MTVLIYVNTSKQVCDPKHLKVFANPVVAETWLQENDPEGAYSNMRCWSEADQASNHGTGITNGETILTRQSTALCAGSSHDAKE
jgi:hypothetical protein